MHQKSIQKQFHTNLLRTDVPKTAEQMGWLTIAEAATYARVCKRTIHNWRNSGLSHVKKNRKTIRILTADIDAFLLRDYSQVHPDSVSNEVDAILKDLTK